MPIGTPDLPGANNSTVAQTVATSANLTEGSLVIVYVSGWYETDSPLSVTSLVATGFTFSPDAHLNGAPNFGVFASYSAVCPSTGSHTFTATFSSASVSGGIHVVEIPGAAVKQFGVYDSGFTQNATITLTGWDNGNTGVAGWGFHEFGPRSGGAVAPEAGWTELGETTFRGWDWSDGNPGSVLQSVYREASSDNTVTTTGYSETAFAGQETYGVFYELEEAVASGADDASAEFTAPAATAAAAGTIVSAGAVASAAQAATVSAEAATEAGGAVALDAPAVSVAVVATVGPASQVAAAGPAGESASAAGLLTSAPVDAEPALPTLATASAVSAGCAIAGSAPLTEAAPLVAVAVGSAAALDSTAADVALAAPVTVDAGATADAQPSTASLVAAPTVPSHTAAQGAPVEAAAEAGMATEALGGTLPAPAEGAIASELALTAATDMASTLPIASIVADIMGAALLTAIAAQAAAGEASALAVIDTSAAAGFAASHPEMAALAEVLSTSTFAVLSAVAPAASAAGTAGIAGEAVANATAAPAQADVSAASGSSTNLDAIAGVPTAAIASGLTAAALWAAEAGAPEGAALTLIAVGDSFDAQPALAQLDAAVRSFVGAAASAQSPAALANLLVHAGFFAVASAPTDRTHKVPGDPRKARPLVLRKDADATLDYNLDLSDWILGVNTLGGIEFEVEDAAAAEDLAVENAGVAGSYGVVWFSGGVVGKAYRVKYAFNDTEEPRQRVDSRTLRVLIVQR